MVTGTLKILFIVVPNKLKRSKNFFTLLFYSTEFNPCDPPKSMIPPSQEKGYTQSILFLPFKQRNLVYAVDQFTWSLKPIIIQNGNILSEGKNIE